MLVMMTAVALTSFTMAISPGDNRAVILLFKMLASGRVSSRRVSGATKCWTADHFVVHKYPLRPTIFTLDLQMLSTLPIRLRMWRSMKTTVPFQNWKGRWNCHYPLVDMLLIPTGCYRFVIRLCWCLCWGFHRPRLKYVCPFWEDSSLMLNIQFQYVWLRT